MSRRGAVRCPDSCSAPATPGPQERLPHAHWHACTLPPSDGRQMKPLVAPSRQRSPSCPSPVSGPGGPSFSASGPCLQQDSAWMGSAFPEVARPVTVGPRQCGDRGRSWARCTAPARARFCRGQWEHPVEEGTCDRLKGQERPAGGGWGGDLQDSSVLGTSREQRRVHPGPCASAGEMLATRWPCAPGPWGLNPFPFPLAVIWLANNNSLRSRRHGLVFCFNPNLSFAVNFEFRCLRSRLSEPEVTSQL